MGREDELAEIHALLLGGAQVALDQRAAKPGGLTGLGGVGKTTLACEYAHRHLDDYEILCWVNAEGQDASSAFAGLAQDPLRLEGLPAEVPERVVAVRQALEQSTGAVLLVFDNVDHPESWPDLVPVGPRVSVLVTTRLTDLDGVRHIDVDRLPPEQALELLLGGAEAARKPPEGAAELCHELDHLTLALAVASKILTKGVRTPAALLAEVRKKGVVPFFEEKGTPKLLRKDSSLQRLFDASVVLLDEGDEVDAHARRMLWVGGWFAAAPIPREVLFHAATILSGGPVPDEVDVAALERLIGLGLAQLDAAGAPFLHRVVREYARHRGGEAASKAVLDALGAVASGTAADIVAQITLGPLRPHLEAAAERLSGSSPVPHLWIALRLAQHLRKVALYAKALAIYSPLAPQLGDGEWAAHFLIGMGQTLQLQGHHEEALEYYRRSLTIQERRLGADHPETALTLNGMGQTLQLQGHHEEALEYYRRSLTIQERRLGADHPETALTLNGMGQTLQLQGHHEEALEYYRRSLAIQERRLGADHPETADVNNPNTVLLLDDQPNVIRWIRDFALSRGYAAEIVTDRKASMERLDDVCAGRRRYALAVVDVMMSVANIWDLLSRDDATLDEKYFEDSRRSGLYICRYAREKLGLTAEQLPIACYTLSDDDEVKQQLGTLGIVLFIKDPGDSEGIRAWLETNLPHHQP